eukprot:XP_011679909.1 PREDICTED: proteasome activator complex subunit 4A-like [Strongylocentrotus purpuratus]
MLFKMMDHFVSSVRLIIPKVLVNLKPDTDIPHHQFKGALYVLSGYSMNSTWACLPYWSILKDVWLGLVNAGHSEKLSIMKVLAQVMMKINKVFDTSAITVKVCTQRCISL